MDTLVQAFYVAAPVWEQAVVQVSWHHAFIAAAYLGAAWLCLLNGHIARGCGEAHLGWYLALALLCALGANTVLSGDVFMTHFVRAAVKLHGWYGERRPAQYLALGALALVLVMASGWLRARLTDVDVASTVVALGLTALLLLFCLRAVSGHATDVVINLRLAGVSVGRLLELAAIGLVLHGALRCLRLR